MLTSRYAVWSFSLGLTVLGADVACGQNYPNKPIRIVTTPAGGSADVAGRLIAQAISGPLGQQVVIDNRPQNVIGEAVAKAPPDGYTLTLIGAAFWIDPLLQKMPYDPVNDFLPITLATRSPNLLVIHPSLPVKSVKELIALAKAKPGELNYGSSGSGSTPHLAAELFKAMAAVSIAHIPYKGGGPAVVSLISGEVQLMFATTASVVPNIKAGKLRALAVTTEQPSALAPGLPTVAATLPGYDATSGTGLFAPAKTPAPIINRLNQEFVRVLNQADLKEKLFNSGVEAVGSSPEDLLARIKAEMIRLGKVIKDVGITAN